AEVESAPVPEGEIHPPAPDRSAGDALRETARPASPVAHPDHPCTPGMFGRSSHAQIELAAGAPAAVVLLIELLRWSEEVEDEHRRPNGGQRWQVKRESVQPARVLLLPAMTPS